MNGDRGQLVLVAAGLIAVALVTLAVAYAQLGYAPDRAGVEGGLDDRTLGEIELAVFEVAADRHGRYVAGEEETARAETLTALDAEFDGLASARHVDRISLQIETDESAAERWTDRNCPGGEGRAFGNCTAADGIVLQERAGSLHVLAVALDVTWTDGDRRDELTVVVDAIRGEREPPDRWREPS